MPRTYQLLWLWIFYIGHHKYYHIGAQNGQVCYPIVPMLSSRCTAPEACKGMRVNAVENLDILNLTDIVLAQDKGEMASMGLNFLSWNWLPLFPIFMVYLISGVAETNRHPFDVVEGEAEIVAGHMVEYSGMGFAIFFLAEYASMWLVSILAVIMFLGGWMSPIDSALFNFIPGWIWLGIKTFLVVSMFIWIRATFPRFRYDQIMRLGWKIFIPVTLVWLLIVGAWLLSPWNIWK